jgi:uncharacterized repeat protein (TIGR03803 family)
VFKVAQDGTETILYSFQDGSDGADPEAGLMIGDKKGDLYGTTAGGGGPGCYQGGCGTVFRLASDGTETVLYHFRRYNDGTDPAAPLLMKDGLLYGTAPYGHKNGLTQFGIVFSVKKR